MIIHTNDYYAQEYFNNPEYTYVRCENVSHGVCPFCGGNITSVNKYIFRYRDIEVAIIPPVASYGICSDCGAI